MDRIIGRTSESVLVAMVERLSSYQAHREIHNKTAHAIAMSLKVRPFAIAKYRKL
ncbi:hypothetical protein N9269_01325 [Akkermansiaceae bacterium]|nr:hypothetical protein [Akkermansiaceae bacterium]